MSGDCDRLAPEGVLTSEVEHTLDVGDRVRVRRKKACKVNLKETGDFPVDIF